MFQLTELLYNIRKEAAGIPFWKALRSSGKGSAGVFKLLGDSKALKKFFNPSTANQFEKSLVKNPNALVNFSGKNYRLAEVNDFLKAGGKGNQNIFSKLTPVGDDAVAIAQKEVQKDVQSVGKELQSAGTTASGTATDLGLNPKQTKLEFNPKAKISPEELKATQDRTNLLNKKPENFRTNAEKNKVPEVKKDLVPEVKKDLVPEKGVVDKTAPEVKTDLGSDGTAAGKTVSDVYEPGKTVSDVQEPGKIGTNWTDRFMQQWEKDPLRTAALTGGGLYAGNKVVNSLFD